MNDAKRRMSRLMVAVVGALALIFAGSGLASAHVTISADETAAGSYALLTVAFSHGCDGSGTTQVSIAVPDEIETINPGMNHGWTVETVSDEAATPAAGEHGESAEAISEIVYTAEEPVPDGFYDQLLLQVKLPDDAAGETIYFPVIQTCEEGETAWVQIPAEGESGDDLESPAPSVTVTEATDDAGH